MDLVSVLFGMCLGEVFVLVLYLYTYQRYQRGK